ncbi:MAG: 2-polyprenyl-3-methyl-6-methoxy-1,4-benzoquinone monooxygenase [Thioalkalispiraceae bacterium]|jgi:ubiquinone biosynthesis monooxygenase Coq7
MNESKYTPRDYSPLDQFINVIDTGLRTVLTTPKSQRAYPAGAHGTETEEDETLTDADKTLAGRFMRINHAGEVAAQGLYTGQALTAKMENVREKMQEAAQEENDHLNWCATRINELGSHTSYLDPFWYAGSVTIGALAGIAGDKWSLGFVAETEKQVVEHLDSHLRKLSPEDNRSRAILEQMKEDEGKHATTALESGGAQLPAPIRGLMKVTAKVMTKTAYWI